MYQLKCISHIKTILFLFIEKSVENCEEKRLKNENDSLILEKKINYSLEKNTNQNLHSNIDYEKESKIKKKFSEVQYTYRNVDTFYANDHLDLKTNNSPKKSKNDYKLIFQNISFLD